MHMREQRHRAALILSGVLLLPAFAGNASPYIPTDPGEVLEQISRPGDAAMRELRQWRKRLDKEPDNLDLAVTLARRYIEVGRQEADPRFYGYAQSALSPWRSLAEPPVDVLLLRATLRQSQHDFDGALTDLSRVLKLRPHSAQAWLTRAVIEQVRGDYAQAARSCAQLFNRVQPLVLVTCTSGAMGLSGQAERSYHMLLAALQTAPDADAGVRVWALTQLAATAARLGKTAEAERHFRAALAVDERDSYLIGAYADFLLDQNRARQVLSLIDKETRIDALLLRRALAEQKTHSAGLAQTIAMLRARFDAARLRGDSVHLREEARFTLHLLRQSAAALGLAEQNWAVQHEPQDARVLLEAALAARKPAAARPVLDWLRHSGLEDIALRRLQTRLSELGT